MSIEIHKKNKDTNTQALKKRETKKKKSNILHTVRSTTAFCSNITTLKIFICLAHNANAKSFEFRHSDYGEQLKKKKKPLLPL